APAPAATVLAASAAEEDVVVGAAKREQSLGDVASAVTVISADRLRRFGYRTIGEAVAGVAGAYLVDNRLSYSIGIRGLQIPGDFNGRILVLVDGASVNEAWGAYAGLGFDAIVGIDEIARIEVIRGPVSSVYGTNAFFGIINVVTRGAAEAPRAWARATGMTINGVLTSAGFAVGGVDRQLRGAVHVADRSGEADLPSVDGVPTQPHGDQGRAFGGSLVGAYGGSFVQIRAVRHARESPFAPYDAAPAGPAYEKIDRHVLLEGGHARELSARLAVAGRGFVNLYRYADAAPPADPIVEHRLDTTGTAESYGAELRGRYALAGERLGLTAGAEASHVRTRSTAVRRDQDGTELANIPKRFQVVGVYAELDGQPASWLGATGGLRFDHHAALDDALSPRAALFLGKPERYGAKLLLAQGFRNPSAFEAYFDDGSDFRAPAGLRAETIRSYEVVLWARPRPGVAVRLSGFDWDARRIIESQTVADPMGNPQHIQFQNVARYVSRGLEAEASYRDRRGWYAFAGAALARVGADDGAGALAFGGVPNAPAVTASAGVSTPRLLGIAHLSTEALLIGERPTRPDIATGAPSPRSPAWLGWNVVAYAPGLGGLDVTLGVRNALGTRELIPTPQDYDRTAVETRTVPRVPGEGREAYVRIGYSY
ncbi:MAG TPA: TonB-dependent receptor, partial [Kofleriaceae bacterium]|nr:TonB-dependent receptor [Kofleriaceae bacterium]